MEEGSGLNITVVREDFPLLDGIIYLDSAATSLTPQPVLNAVRKYYETYNANTGRGVHRLSQIASQRYDDAHWKVAGFIGAQPQEVIFTKNATEAINTVARGLPFKVGDKVVTTLVEHHSNFLPWLQLKDRGVLLNIIEPDEEGHLDPSRFEDAIDDETRLVAVTHVSNVLGTINPIAEIAAICRRKGALLLVDGAQSVPHVPVSVGELGCDFLCFSGHKMLGPTGTGVLWMKERLFNELSPLAVGGGMIDDVSLEGYHAARGYAGFEAGTPNIAGGIGLGAAVDYLDKIGMEAIQAHEAELTAQLLTGLLQIEGVTIYGDPRPNKRIGVAAFNIDGLNPHDVALMLDEAADIMVRSGHQCCMPLMNQLGLHQGLVRVSVYLYNTKQEIETLLETVKRIVAVE